MKYDKQIILKDADGNLVTIIVDENRVKILGTLKHLTEWEVVSQDSKDNLSEIMKC